MSTLKVPLIGTNVTPSSDSESGTAPTLMDREPPRESRWDNGTFVPSGRTSLHRVKIRPAEQAEMEPVFEENSRAPGRYDVKYRPVERRAEPQAQPPAPPEARLNEAQQRQLDVLTDAVARQYGIERDNGPQMPNPAAYDFYDPQQEGQYHADLQKFIEHEKQQALAPHQAAIEQTKVAQLYNEVASKYRDHPNFADIEAAAQYALRHYDGKSSLEQIFANAVDPAKARPGWAGNIHVPRAIRGQLGAIVAHRAMIKKQWGR